MSLANDAQGATDDHSADRSVVRSEEHLEVGTVVVESRRLRLRKVVTTEIQTVTVEVRREQVVLEEVPLGHPGDGPATGTGRALSDEPVVLAELVLHEERPVVSTVVVPVERVRLWCETDVGSQTVSAEVGREQVELVAEE